MAWSLLVAPAAEDVGLAWTRPRPVAGGPHHRGRPPALQILGTKPGSRLVSSVFLMCLPGEVVIEGDCVINPQPGAKDLADIAIQSAASLYSRRVRRVSAPEYSATRSFRPCA